MKKILLFVVFLLIGFLGYFTLLLYPKLELISGFCAKSIASGHFIDGRPLDLIEREDNDIPMLDLATNKILKAPKEAISAVYGLKERQAIFREGLGVTLVDEDFDLTKPFLVPHRSKRVSKEQYPFGDTEPKDTLFSNVDYAKLHKAVDGAFDKDGGKTKRTRAVVVLYKNHLIAEEYGPWFSKKSKILGWSMTKSVTSAVYGAFVKQRKLDIYKPCPVESWKNDERKRITLNNLLQMNSGLEWVEDYGEISDVTKMLFQSYDMGKVQEDKPLEFKPNTHWYYSSGTSNLLSRILRQQFPSQQAYLDFWYSALIDKIGMHSMLIETDMAGNYVGSSYAWATPRDWAKFGLLYLNKGNWNGEQVLDESWVKYSHTPTPTSNNGYGAQFWLNKGGKFPDVPRDMYYCSGYQGQMVAIIPSRDMVIVRMGLKEHPDFDFNKFLKEVLASVSEVK